MQPALLLRLRPLSPFRFGPASGARDQTDLILHSDSLFSAVSIAMRQFGRLSEWLAATVEAGTPAVRLSSLFPYQGSRLFAVPPRTLWPPPATKLRAKSVRFLPLEAVRTLANGGTLSEDRWVADASSQCLLPIEKNQGYQAPFRVRVRRSAAVDRQVHGRIELHSTACLEFSENAGLWCLAVFRDEAAKAEWGRAVESSFRLLGDSGIGGERSLGWGRFALAVEPPVFPDLTARENGGPLAWWMLSLFSPAASDEVDWERGNYALLERRGRVDRTGDLKLAGRMVEEGGVLVAPAMPAGAAQDVAPEGNEHPVYRAGFGVALPIRYTPPRAPFIATETRQAEPAPEAPVVTETPAIAEPVSVTAPAPLPDLLTPAGALPAIEAPPESLQLAAPEPAAAPESAAAPEPAVAPESAVAPEPEIPGEAEPQEAVDPWGWEPQETVREDAPRNDDSEPKGGQS